MIVYRPPCVNNNLFLDEFSDYLSLILITAPGYLLVSGDFNFHVDDTCDRTALRFLDILQSFNLTQNISCSTHIAGQTLDLVITRCGEDFASSFEVSDPGISDDLAVKCKLQFAKPIPQKKKVFYRNLKSVSVENFCTDLQNSELLKSADALDLNELLSCYNRTLASLLDTHAPLKCRLIPCLLRMPWFTAEIGQVKRKRRQLEWKWGKMKTEKSH